MKCMWVIMKCIASRHDDSQCTSQQNEKEKHKQHDPYLGWRVSIILVNRSRPSQLPNVPLELESKVLNFSLISRKNETCSLSSLSYVDKTEIVVIFRRVEWAGECWDWKNLTKIFYIISWTFFLFSSEVRILLLSAKWGSEKERRNKTEASYSSGLWEVI